MDIFLTFDFLLKPHQPTTVLFLKIDIAEEQQEIVKVYC